MARLSQTKRLTPLLLCAAALGGCAGSAWAQNNANTWPFAPRSATPAGTPAGTPKPATAPRDVPLVEERWEDLSNRDLGRYGETALVIARDKWRHAETDNFILHYRRVTEAQKVAREVEFDLWFVVKTLGATKERYQRKSHVFVFEDDEEWKIFLGKAEAAPWMISFAYGDELFLNVRKTQDTGRFDSNTLAHETTHAVVARLYPDSPWPLWLNEGWAEYMGGASVAARKGQPVKRHQSALRFAAMPLEEMERVTVYPQDIVLVAQLYQTSEKLIRFLMSEMPAERIVQFIAAALTGKSLAACVREVYGDQVKDWADFQKRFNRFDS